MVGLITQQEKFRKQAREEKFAKEIAMRKKERKRFQREENKINKVADNFVAEGGVTGFGATKKDNKRGLFEEIGDLF